MRSGVTKVGHTLNHVNINLFNAKEFIRWPWYLLIWYIIKLHPHINIAIHTLEIVYLHILDVGCFSHTMDHIGVIKIQTYWMNMRKAGLDCCSHAVQRQDWLGRKVQVCQSLHTQPFHDNYNGRSRNKLWMPLESNE